MGIGTIMNIYAVVLKFREDITDIDSVFDNRPDAENRKQEINSIPFLDSEADIYVFKLNEPGKL